MSKHMDDAVPYLWILGLLAVAIASSSSYFAIFPSFVAGIWGGALLADKSWKRISPKERNDG